MKNTAVITGASSGIGYELAKIFAKNNINILLVARSEAKLHEIASEIKSQSNVEVRILTLDLSKTESAQELFNHCKSNNYQINYLINNAGFGDLGLFAESKLEKQEQMIDLNIKSLTSLCHLFLPQMLAQKSGKIMNLASVAAFQPAPFMSVYAATKAYVLHFSEAINNELQGSGVSVTALCPGATQTGFADAANASNSKIFKTKSLPSAKQVADYGYNAMMKGKSVAIHGAFNSILTNSVRFVPRNLVVKISRLFIS